MQLTSSEIKHLVDAVERARSDMGRGFFWYFFRHDGIVVEDPGLTDTGYSNLAGHMCRHVDPKRWTVKAEADRLRIKATERVPAPTKKYMFSLKFEANPVIEAHTVEEAEAKAFELMKHRAVVDICTGDGDEDYVAQEPYFLEEVKE